VPASIDEAAKIDGAGHARIFFTIILRLVAPILAVVALLSFIASVNEFVVASVLLIDTDKQTLAVGLTKLVSNPRYADWSAFSAGAVIAALPVVALFLFLQKYIVGGLTAGAVK
jgi:arabinogalactan oligomer/maltooligosaccharide transport system permease protein